MGTKTEHSAGCRNSVKPDFLKHQEKRKLVREVWGKISMFAKREGRVLWFKSWAVSKNRGLEKFSEF